MPPGPRRRPRTLLEPPQRANAADEKIRPDARLQKAPTGGSPHHPPAAKAGATPRGVSRFPLPALSAESHASTRRLAAALLQTTDPRAPDPLLRDALARAPGFAAATFPNPLQQTP